MQKASKVKQLVAEMKNKVGLLTDLSVSLGEAKVNIKAICGYEMDDRAYFMLITDDNVKARRVLKKIGAALETDDVVALEMDNKPGALGKAAQKISGADIDIHYLYASTGIGKTSLVIMKTDDDAKTVRLINKK